jgi:hypothetical protein
MLYPLSYGGKACFSDSFHSSLQRVHDNDTRYDTRWSLLMTKPTPRRTASRTTPGRHPKPYEGFPLFHHRNGQWAKKVRGKLHD